MPLFTLWRTLDHTLGEAERENITIRAIGACEWFPGVRWQRSFVIDEPGRLQSLCVYEGPTLEAVRDQSTRCVIPFTEIREVIELASLRTQGPDPLGPDGLFMVDRAFPSSTDVARLQTTLEAAADIEGVAWLRSYVDAERRSSRCILRAKSAAAIHDHARSSGLPCGAVEAVLENHPASWGDVYDGFRLPRHWESAPMPAKA